MDKMAWMHMYLVEQSKIVHQAWVKEHNLRDACCDNTKGQHSTMGVASLVLMFSDLASNQQHLATTLRQQQARNDELARQMGHMLQLLESGHGMNGVQSTSVSEGNPLPMQEATLKEPAAASLVAIGKESTRKPRALDSWL
jgi:ABC-type branched-subunit amino acid transport system ATPase component